MALYWNRAATPLELHSLLETLKDGYPISEEPGGTSVAFVRSEDRRRLRVAYPSSGRCVIEYGTPSAAARGIGYALAGGRADEDVYFTTFGVNVDVSRAPVMTVAHFKVWLRRLALLGCNIAMLYTKDTYQLPGEPYFGYMRGAYSLEEIREIDAYAQRLHVEVVASIQALGHLEPILRWSAYTKVRDTANVLMVDEPETYVLLRKMIAFWSEALSSRRIHLGMDETHDLGRGRFMDRNGYERGWDIYNRHLAKVCGICEEFSLKPIIWSDMYFRFASKTQNYYDMDTVIPDDVRDAIPKSVQLSYWDYYSPDKERYVAFLEKHRRLGGEPLMASAIWTWKNLWFDQATTRRNAGAAIEGCREAGVREILFTMWGDDGGYSELDSSFAGIAWAADCAFNPQGSRTERIAPLFHAVCGSDYRRHLLASRMNFIVAVNGDMADAHWVHAPAILWDDPLMGIIHREGMYNGAGFWRYYLDRMVRIEQQLAPYADDRECGDFGHILHALRVLIKKTTFREKLVKAYRDHDFPALLALADEAEGSMVESIGTLILTYRRQWMRSYKTFGQEVMQIRLGGLIERYRETARILREYVHGDCAKIEELEGVKPGMGARESNYRMIATAGWFI